MWQKSKQKKGGMRVVNFIAIFALVFNLIAGVFNVGFLSPLAESFVQAEGLSGSGFTCAPVTSNGFTFELIDSSCDDGVSYTIKVTNDNDKALNHFTFALPAGVVPVSPVNGDVYVGTQNDYNIEFPTNNPFYGIKFEVIGEGVKDGGFEIFNIVLDQEYDFVLQLEAKAGQHETVVEMSCGGMICEPDDPEIQVGDIVINEIMQNPEVVTDAKGEWFEVYNTTSSDINLENCVISDNGTDSHIISSELIVPALGYAVLGRNADTSINGGVNLDYQYSGFILGNDDDELALICNDVEIDRVEYDGGPNFPSPVGKSMILADPLDDNNVGANWCESLSVYGNDNNLGTPGALNDECGVNEVPVVCDPNIELIDNGSFESPTVDTLEKWNIFISSAISGWSVDWMATVLGESKPEDAYLEFHRGLNGWLSQSGEQHVELDSDWDGPGGSLNNEPASVEIYQDINTVIGEEYELNFYFSPRPSRPATDNILGVVVGTEIDEVVNGGAGQSNTTWLPYTYSFTASDETTRVAFSDLGDANSFGGFLDNVSVKCSSGDEPPVDPPVDEDLVCGYKFHDENQNGEWDGDENGLEDWTINLEQHVSCDPSESWADEVVAYNPVGPIDEQRMHSERALGPTDYDASNGNYDFVSLGNGGSLILKFNNYIINGPGDDIEVTEQTWHNPTCDEYPEQVRVYASQTGEDDTWVDLGVGCQDATFELGELPWAQYVKLVDETGGATPDGYDVDAVRAIHCSSGFEVLDSAITDENGQYCFNDVLPGDYRVIEELQDGWINSTPLYQDIVVTEGQSVLNINFGNYIEPSDEILVCGYKFHDENQNGEWDGDESGLEDWTINLEQHVSCDPSESWADEVVDYSPVGSIEAKRSDPKKALGLTDYSDIGGTYNFVSLGNGGSLTLKFNNYIINGPGDDIEVTEQSWNSPSCEDWPEKVRVYASQTGEDDTWVDLGTGCQDATFDLGELPWAQYVKLVDETDNSIPGGYDVDAVRAIHCSSSFEVIDTAVTSEDGGYCFNDVLPGDYRAIEQLQTNWFNSTLLYQDIVVTEGQSVLNINFGNYQDQSQVVSVDIDADPIVVAVGGSTEITWSSDNAISCVGDNFDTGGATSGTVVVSDVSEDTTFSVTCESVLGDETTDSVTVTVTTPPLLVLFGDNPLVINLGNDFVEPGYSATSTVNNASLTHLVEVTGTVATSTVGTSVLTYVVTDPLNNLSTTTTREIHIQEPEDPAIVPTVSIDADPQTVSSGGSSTISWSSVNADSCVGVNFSTAGATSGSVATGALTVSTVFSVNCISSTGHSSSVSTTVNVTTVTPPGGNGGGGSGGGGGGGFMPLIIHNESVSSYCGDGGCENFLNVLVRWFTNKPADSRVIYDVESQLDMGVPPNYGYSWSTNTFNENPKVTYHEVVITGLDFDTIYYFRPISAASPEVYGMELMINYDNPNPNSTPTPPTPTPDPTPTPTPDPTPTPTPDPTPTPTPVVVPTTPDSETPTEVDSDEETDVDEDTGLVAGEEEVIDGYLAGVAECSFVGKNWLILFLLVAFLFALWLNYKSKEKKDLAWAFVLLVTLMPVPVILACSRWLWWMWLLVGATYLITLALHFIRVFGSQPTSNNSNSAVKNDPSSTNGQNNSSNAILSGYWPASLALTALLIILLIILEQCAC